LEFQLEEIALNSLWEFLLLIQMSFDWNQFNKMFSLVNADPILQSLFTNVLRCYLLREQQQFQQLSFTNELFLLNVNLESTLKADSII